MRVEIDVESHVSRSTRARQLEGSFDVPPADAQRLSWRADLPLDERSWNVGLIVGPSGCGKSTIVRDIWGDSDELTWSDSGVIDDFPGELSIDDVASICSAVGFNTIPAWLRPYAVLSNGERFRVELARRLATAQPGTPLVLDEWTSVVDRQVARIGSHAAQRYVRRHDLQLVAATCHYDVVDWLQPDWVLEPRASHLDSHSVESIFEWRSVQSRPQIDVEIAPAPHAAWDVFAPFHYLTASLAHAAKCYVLWARVDDTHDWQPAAFAGLLHRPHAAPKAGPVWGVSRVVTLPDWQGLGLAFALMDTLGAAYRAQRCQLHMYPAHPALIAAHDRSSSWQLIERPGIHSTQAGPNSTTISKWRPRGRPNAVFRYCGPRMQSRRESTLLFRCGR